MTDSMVEKNEKKRELLKDVYCLTALFMAGVATAGLIRSNFNYRLFTTCFVTTSVVYLVFDWYYKHNITRLKKLDPQTKI